MNLTGKQSGRWPLAVFMSGLVMLAAMLLLLRYPPLADMVEWEYQAFITSKLMLGQSVGPFYLRPYPVPYLTSQVLMAGFNVVVNPALAGQLTLLLYLVLGAVLAVRFVKANELDPVLAYPLLLGCIICNSSFWSGYLNYQFGLLVIMAYLSLSPRQQASAWINGCFAVVAFACHGFCFVAFGVLAGMISLSRGPRAVLSLGLACLPSLVLLVWYMLAHSNDTMSPMEAPVAYGSLKFVAYKLYTLSKAGPYQNFMLGAQVDAMRLPVYYWLGVLANGVVAMLLLTLLWRVTRLVRDPVRRGLAWGALTLALMYVLAPSVALQVVNPGERLLYPQLLVVFALALKSEASGARREWPRSVRLAASGLAFGFVFATLCSLLWATHLQGYETVVKEQFAEANKSPIKVLYWHRPYQFKARFEHMMQSHEQNTQPTLRLIFPTSLIGQEPARP